MKRLLLLFVFLISGTAVATYKVSKDLVNQALVNFLSPYPSLFKSENTKSEDTKIELEFTNLNLTDGRIESANAVGRIEVARKTEEAGKTNPFVLSLRKFNYVNKPPEPPSFRLQVSFKDDLLERYGQELLNKYEGQINSMIEKLIAEQSKMYGSAVTTNIEIVKKEYDQNGDIKALRMQVDMAVDLSQLPEGVPASDIEILEGSAVLNFTRSWSSFEADVVMNPKYKRFQYGNDVGSDGLQEMLDGLINNVPAKTVLLDRALEFLLKFAHNALGENQQ